MIASILIDHGLNPVTRLTSNLFKLVFVFDARERFQFSAL